MKKTALASIISGLAMMWIFAVQDPAAAFTVVQSTSFTASVTVGTAGASGPVTLTISQALPVQAFFGKNVVIPLQLQGSATTLAQIQKQQGNASGVGVQVFYQLFNSGGAAVGGTLSLPIAFQSVSGQADVMNGTAIIPVESIQAARGGSLTYFFQLQNGAQTIQYKNAGTPYTVQFIDTLTASVQASGSIVTVPDTTPSTDGKTSLVFAPGALTSDGTITIHQLDQLTVPSGPGGLLPITVYDLELQGTSLAREVGLTFTYPWNPDGSIIGTNGNAGNLAPYWLQGPGNWTVMGPRQFDPAKHIVSWTSPHFSTFALFLSGATSAEDLRPTRRILTPNGDGINDTVDFSGIGVGESVQIFNVKGRRIRSLHFPNLVWDGRDDGGGIVESGIYIYQYTSQGERVSGVILVAK